MPKRSQSLGIYDSIKQAITQKYDAAIAEVDAVLQKYGLAGDGRAAGSRTGRGGPPAKQKTQKTMKKAGGGRKRRSFPETAEKFVLSLVGGKGASTGDINKAWKDSGRGGSADNQLSAMVKAKKIKRTTKEGVRGSVYSRA